MPFADPSDGARVAFESHGAGALGILLPLIDIGWKEAGYVDDLARDHQVVLVDPRGFGESTWFPDLGRYGLWKCCDDLIAAANAAGLDRFAAIGFSNTGLRCVALASLTPRVVAVGCGAFPLGQHMYRQLREHAVTSREAGPGGYGNTAGFDWGDTVAAMDDEDRWIVPPLNRPALFWYGERDPFAPTIRASRAYFDQLGFDVRELPGLDHGTGFSRAEVVVPLLRDLLRRAKP